jgi:anti-sigma factor RsiW
MADQWTDRLSEYLDDELTRGERDALESHVAACADCARTLAELQVIVASANSLPARPPANDLWPGVARRTVDAPPAERGSVAPFPQAARSRRRISFTPPQLAAAAVLLAALSSGLAWQFRGTQADPALTDRPATAGSATAGASADSIGAGGAILPVSLGDQEYDAAVSDLEKTLEAGRAVLDPATIAIVEQNLAIIDVAIEQAREALETDPANGYLSSYLVQARRKKLDLLRRAAAMAAESAQS